MNHLAVLLVTVLAAFSAFAEDGGKTTSYTAEVTGVVCAACKMHVTEAFKKMPGVEKVEFARGEKEGTQKVTFASTAASLTREDAVKTLGDASSQYSVVSLNKTK